ncbi:MAG: LLM class flavin-dependent oxidoreductase [Candidatus Rokubacteria bacterium]|nr:LLM class flavin-dependent oxidoreductase [Candidatus Rokubacteria bacterium]
MNRGEPVRFGINFMPTAPAAEVVRWARLVEDLGYELLGISDSQSICRDVYMTLALCAVNTERIRFGPRVITPVTRHPAVAASAAATLDELAPGRTLVAMGSGDSAAYNVGLRPASLAELREYAETIRALLATGRAEYHGKAATLTWKRARLPIYLAASGPKTLHLAGQIADGVVIRTGILPEIVRDSIAQVRAGAVAAGRDPDAIDLWWWPDVNVATSYREGVEEIKMSLAAAGNHLSRFTTAGKHIPPELLENVRALGQRYAFASHTLPGSANNRLIEELGLVDYLADRFAAVGTPADCVKKLTAAVDAGARQFWMSVHFDDKERFLRDWAEKVAPAFR